MVLQEKNGVKKFDPKLLKLISKGKNEEVIRILETVDPSKLLDSSGKSLLHWTMTKLGHPDFIKYLIDKGCDVNAQDEAGNTPLWSAVNADQGYLMYAMVQANANIHIPNKKGESPVQYILREWFLPGRAVAKLFLDKLREECGDDKQLLVNKLINFKCPIYLVVLLRDAEITRMMLDRGCSVNVRCHRTRDTALHEAVAQSDFENVKVLVEGGIDVNDRSDYGHTPLYRYNVYPEDTQEKLEMLKFLITKGATFISSECYPSPVDKIMEKGRKETISALLRMDGIDWRARNKWGTTAFHIVCHNDNPGVADSIRLFHCKDVDVNTIDKHGQTPLIIASRKGFVDAVGCLLEMGADTNILDSEGFPAMHSTYKDLSKNFFGPIEDYQKIVDLLLFYGTDARYFSSFLDMINLKNGSTHKAESVLARLAEMKMMGPSKEILSTQRKIKCVKKYEDYFDMCTKKLQEMQLTKVYESVSLVDLLNGISDKKLLQYARNSQFREAFNLTCKNKFDTLPHYYSSIITHRVTKAIARIDVEKSAVSVICKIIGLNDGRIVALEIVGYLQCYDLKNLNEVV